MSDWIEFNKSYKEFENLGLANPGTLIEVTYLDQWTLVDDTKTDEFLIGNINEIRGICDDCVAFGKDAIVNKYKVIWNGEE